MSINKKVFTFFINNLSFCALNKQKKIPIYSKIETPEHLNAVQDWFQSIVKLKSFHENTKQPKLMYFYFPDRNAVIGLDEIFNEISFEDYRNYFDFCYERIKSTYDENNLELFSCINLFHLVGSFRYFRKNSDDVELIRKILYGIILGKKEHPLIKYSALQIITLLEVEGKSDPNSYSKKIIYDNAFAEQMLMLEGKDDAVDFSKYISFYSMYYYNNEFNPLQLVKEEYFKKILVGNEVDFRYLHTLIPQIASLLIRLDRKAYLSNKFNDRLQKVFESNMSNASNLILDLKERICHAY